jgi:uncharacterized protein with GYD domain
VDRARDKKLQGHYKTCGCREREAERIGGKLTVYWTFGEYDMVCILETPNDEAAMEFGLKVGSLGNVRTATLRAFTEEEMAKITNKLG